MICAGHPSGGKDACQGDAGSPLVKVDENIHTQIGIVSGGHECGRDDAPGVYSRVSHNIDWMRKQICNEWFVESSLCRDDLLTCKKDCFDPTQPVNYYATCLHEKCKSASCSSYQKHGKCKEADCYWTGMKCVASKPLCEDCTKKTACLEADCIWKKKRGGRCQSEE
mmetsp:Transcript_23170/g.23455  ORF Transcript_23170/g.23455 Transcript_23170/m.23455 type:complete len:167 (+) Transcript_23170:741-1241(+)